MGVIEGQPQVADVLARWPSPRRRSRCTSTAERARAKLGFTGAFPAPRRSFERASLRQAFDDVWCGTEMRGARMGQPIVYVDVSHIREGRLGELETAMNGL